MKILLTGAAGFVGSRIATAMPVIPCPSLRQAAEDDVKRIIDAAEPDVIIHTAAISDIPSCEEDPAASYRANVEIPVWIVKCGVKAVLFSTDQVYGLCRHGGPYREEDAEPGNVYAAHKLEMENRTLEINPDTVLLRATWMYDMPMFGVPNRGNFLVNMLFQREAAFSSGQHRAVTYVREVARQTERALSLPGGVYNFGSENSLTMMETAEWLKERLKLPVALREAGERHNLWMDCRKAKALGIEFADTVGGMERCIRDYGL